MLVLLNKERVLVEMLEWAHLRLANILKVPIQAIDAKWELNDDDDIVPTFKVDAEQCEGLDTQTIGEVIENVAHQMKVELRGRMIGLQMYRTEHFERLFERGML